MVDRSRLFPPRRFLLTLLMGGLLLVTAGRASEHSRKVLFDAANHEDPQVREALAVLVERGYFDAMNLDQAPAPPPSVAAARPPQEAPVDLHRLVQVAFPCARAKAPGIRLVALRAYQDPKKPLGSVWTVRFANEGGRHSQKVYQKVDVRTWTCVD